jgi:hypothetical protein
MFYDTQRIKNLDKAKKAASIYLRVYGYKELRIGKLIPENKEDRERFAVELPTTTSPTGKICDSAKEVGPGYRFKPLATLRKK